MTAASGNPRYSIAGQAPQFPVLQPTGTCAVCGRTYRLKNDGILRSHWKRDGQGKGLPYSDPCPGTGQPPKEQS